MDDIIKDILNERLIPNNISEDSCTNILYETQEIKETFPRCLELIFNYPKVSTKVSLAKRLIDNSMIQSMNITLEQLGTRPTRERVLYKLMNIKRKLKEKITYIQKAIDDNGYDLSLLQGQRFNKYSAEKAYILNYVKVSLIWYIMEFQSHFPSMIPDDKLVTLDIIFNQYLQMAAPAEAFIKEIRRIEPEPQPELDLDIETERMPDVAQIFVNITKPFGFLELKNIKALPNTQRSLFITHFTAMGVPYIAAMLDFLGYPRHLKNAHNMNSEAIFKHISEALNGASIRTIKGNLNILKPESKEDPIRYTSQQHIEEVKEDYNKFLCAND